MARVQYALAVFKSGMQTQLGLAIPASTVGSTPHGRIYLVGSEPPEFSPLADDTFGNMALFKTVPDNSGTYVLEYMDDTIRQVLGKLNTGAINACTTSVSVRCLVASVQIIASPGSTTGISIDDGATFQANPKTYSDAELTTAGWTTSIPSIKLNTNTCGISLLCSDFFIGTAYAPTLPVGRSNLYHIRNIFLLRVGEVIYEIREPIKWDSILIAIEFDESTNAYKFEFTDKAVLLEFDKKAGFDKIQAEYAARGVDADVSLKFGEISQGGITTILYEGALNFSPGSYSENKSRCKANCERQSLSQKLVGYFDLPTDVFSPASLDGTPMTPLALTPLYMHPRQLTYAADFIYNYNVSSSQYDLFDNAHTYGLGDRARSTTGKIYESRLASNTGHEPTTNPGWWLLSTSFPAVLEDEIDPGPGTDPHYKTVVPPFKIVANNVPDVIEPVPTDGVLLFTGTLPAGVSKRVFFIESKVSFKVHLGNQSQFINVGFSVWKRPGAGGSFPPVGVGAVPPEDQITHDELQGNVAHDVTMSALVSGTITMFANETLYVRAYAYTPDDALFDVSDFQWLDYASHYLRIREQTVYAPTIINVLRIHEAVNRQFEIITDIPRVMKSNFFGRIDLGYDSNGCGSNQYLMNGLMIRRIPSAFLLSAKVNFNSLNGIYNMGISIERDMIGGEFIRFEPLEYFFRNVLVYAFTDVSDYSRYPSDRIFNTIGIEFTKYPQDNQQDSLEDIFTKFDVITPVVKFKNQLKILIDYILSPYYLEYTRRQGLEVNPSNAYETDNNTFMVSGTSPTQELGQGIEIVWVAAGSIVTVGKVLSVIVGDVIVFAGGASNDGEYTVLAVDIAFNFDSTVLTVAEIITDATTTSDISLIGPARASAKRDEDFDSVTGVTFPHSVYNLEHHLERILLRWAKYFQSGWSMYVKALEGETSLSLLNKYMVRFVSGANNMTAATLLKTSVSCAPGDSLRVKRFDNGNLHTQQMDKPLFTKDNLSCKAKINWAIFNYIRTAFEGRNPDGKNYGFFTIKNPKGVTEKGFLESIKLDPKKEIVTIILKEKYE